MGVETHEWNRGDLGDVISLRPERLGERFGLPLDHAGGRVVGHSEVGKGLQLTKRWRAKIRQITGNGIDILDDFIAERDGVADGNFSRLSGRPHRKSPHGTGKTGRSAFFRKWANRDGTDLGGLEDRSNSLHRDLAAIEDIALHDESRRLPQHDLHLTGVDASSPHRMIDVLNLIEKVHSFFSAHSSAGRSLSVLS